MHLQGQQSRILAIRNPLPEGLVRIDIDRGAQDGIE